MKYGYINEQGYLVSERLKAQPVAATNLAGAQVALTLSIEEQAELKIEKGYKPVEEKDEAKMRIEGQELYFNYPVPYDAGDKILYRYEKKFDFFQAGRKVEELKNELTSTDHKVFKVYEAVALGMSQAEALPKTLIEKRQELRGQINALQELIAQESKKQAEERGLSTTPLHEASRDTQPHHEDLSLDK